MKLASGQNKSALSRTAGLPGSAIDAIVNKGRMPLAENGVKIARALGVTSDWLYDDGAGWPPPSPTTFTSPGIQIAVLLPATMNWGELQTAILGVLAKPPPEPPAADAGDECEPADVDESPETAPQIPEPQALTAATVAAAGMVRLDREKFEAARVRRLLLPSELCRRARLDGRTLGKAFGGKPIEAAAAAAIAAALDMDLADLLPAGATRDLERASA